MLENIQRNRGFYLFESLVFIFLGILAIILPGLMTLSIELLLGCLFLIGGVVQGLRTLRGGRGRGFAVSLLSAALSIIVGILMLLYPVAAVFTLTLLLMIFFILEGIAEIVLSLRLKGAPGRGWLLFAGIVTLLLGILIWSDLPGSAVWVIGLLVGINLLLFGLSQLMITLSASRR